MKYVEGKGYFVGTYTEHDLAKGKDKAAVAKMMKKTGCQYTNSEFVKKNGKIVGITLYVCHIKKVKL